MSKNNLSVSLLFTVREFICTVLQPNSKILTEKNTCLGSIYQLFFFFKHGLNVFQHHVKKYQVFLQQRRLKNVPKVNTSKSQFIDMLSEHSMLHIVETLT